MAEEKKEKTKKTPVDLFREKLQDRAQLKETVLEGIKSASGRIRSLSIKAAYKTQEHAFIKQYVLPLINSDKSKKVLRTISKKVTRTELAKKVKSMMKPKAAHTKKVEEAGDEAAETPKA